MARTDIENRDLVARVRQLSGLVSGIGPDDEHLSTGIAAFEDQFEYWYLRVMRAAVPAYRNLIIERINPFIRRMELKGKGPEAIAARLVEDYEQRNFVTAGGWALEAMAIATSPDGQKSAARGIDMERVVGKDRHLYVLKSGPVTRNSDIISSLKQHSKQAEKLLRQNRGAGEVKAKYAVMTGKTSSTYHDGVWRPSSEEFWSEVLGLETAEAVELAMAIASVASALVLLDVAQPIFELTSLVAEYIRSPETPETADWEYIKLRTLRSRELWRDDDATRHARAEQALNSNPYLPLITPGEAVQQAET
ncbi:MAG TPA: PmeII family type II restriction endonuclease [Actinomycetota bacterium]|nr:PmeII family type II restriction endonuclease [Actinomycetota bacterium]